MAGPMYKICILSNEDPYDHISWIKACDHHKEIVNYRVINLTMENWLNNINQFRPDLLLLKPSGKTSVFRTLYQERIEILVNELKYSTFPSLEELRIYENKRFLSYWLEAHNLPHPKTWVFYDKLEAEDWLQTIECPIVGKMNIGASGNGVRILKSKENIKNYIKTAFSKGLISNVGPKFKKGKILVNFWRKAWDIRFIKNRLKTYSIVAQDSQKGHVIFQEYVKHDFEWRVVRIGDSFFAHKKLKIGEKASGSLKKQYENPPFELLSFVKTITDKYSFRSVAIDIFARKTSEYLINEIQCIFGQSDPYQMTINGTPGRYYWDNKWVFEAGDFNSNLSYDLRVSWILSQAGFEV